MNYPSKNYKKPQFSGNSNVLEFLLVDLKFPFIFFNNFFKKGDNSKY